MMALVAWIPGIPLVYQEMEDGSFDAFRAIFRLREANPILTEGEVDYLAPAAPDGVFACTRTFKNARRARHRIDRLSGEMI